MYDECRCEFNQDLAFPDASKRRQLPAWIREGLEKMEREKQKQIEREKTIQDSQTTKKLHGANSNVNNDAQQSEPFLPPKSRFVSKTN
jgi:hypothetical protein